MLDTLVVVAAVGLALFGAIRGLLRRVAPAPATVCRRGPPFPGRGRVPRDCLRIGRQCGHRPVWSAQKPPRNPGCGIPSVRTRFDTRGK